MFTNQIIRHKDADASFLERVIVLKQSAWPYPKESQMAWMRDNLKDDDFHVILMQEGRDIAYLNLCDVRCEINGVEARCKGIGNVCSIQSGGGKFLLSLVNQYLVDNNKIGILFCKDTVLGFYKKCNWNLINPQKVTFAHLPARINTMMFNYPEIEILRYKDRNF